MRNRGLVSGGLLAVALGLVVGACGSAAGGSPSPASGGAGGSSGSNAAGGVPGAAGAVTTAGAGGSAATAGAGGSPTSGCAGSYGNPRTLLSADPADSLASPALSADELELFYAQETAQVWNFRRSTRLSKSDVFPIGTIVGELDAACQGSDDRTLDLAADGLRIYLHCEPIGTVNGPVRIARRATRDATFVLDQMVYGVTGGSIALSADELSLYSTSETMTGMYTAPLFYTRPDLISAFGAATPIPGLEATTMHALDISADGRYLFGAIDRGLVLATRAGATGPFQLSPGPLADDPDIRGAPEHSADCNSLYFIQVPAPAVGGGWMIRVASR